jgi:hypothetical protein
MALNTTLVQGGGVSMADNTQQGAGSDAWDARQWHVVRPGDTLSKLAAHYYGDATRSWSRSSPAARRTRVRRRPGRRHRRQDARRQGQGGGQSYKGGNLMDAITKGSVVKTKAAELLTMLGMPVPDALKG